MKAKPATQLGCCYKRKALDGLGGSLFSSLDFRLYQDDQVCSADTSQPLPDTMDARDLPWSERMCPLPLAPAKPSLLACPEGLDLRLCALQKIPLGRASQDLGEDASNTSESGALGLDLGALLVG
ncbi:tissue-resident T-cell transcription regulator protein ZNF683-like [Rattus rattus]|uniref:tissue-resident T-cell transcription regulator protein ZNF683-like n=1 Tax=Rattus rattus TaxID=10117 RepID=UPI0013F2DFDB|nr:tissue-resident T-cell transcription regulator protein ZNF683-like [Rattus rattus]